MVPLIVVGCDVIKTVSQPSRMRAIPAADARMIFATERVRCPQTCCHGAPQPANQARELIRHPIHDIDAARYLTTQGNTIPTTRECASLALSRGVALSQGRERASDGAVLPQSPTRWKIDVSAGSFTDAGRPRTPQTTRAAPPPAKNPGARAKPPPRRPPPARPRAPPGTGPPDPTEPRAAPRG